MRDLLIVQRRLKEVEARKRQKVIQGQAGGLIEFVKYFWHVLEPNTTFVDGWALRAICDHLEAVTFGEIKRLLVNVPPGFCKSLLTDVFWPAWEWGAMNRPHIRYVAFSYSAGLTERDNGKFRDLLQSTEFQQLYGDRFSLRKIGETKVTNNKTGSKLASSVGGIGTGERGNRVVLDDPHNIKEGESEVIRTETVRWFREAMSNRLNDLAADAIVIIMQRVHESDVSGTILANDLGYVHLKIPMEFEANLVCTTPIGWTDPRTEDGELAWPERFPEEQVLTLQRQIGPYAYASQYQQRPVARGGGILKEDWWDTWDADRAWPVFDYILASLDTAYTGKQENDPSALTIWGIYSDERGRRKVMMIHAWSDHLEFHKLIEKTAVSCKKYKVDKLLVEAKASGISVAQELRRLHNREAWGVETINPGSLDKAARVHSIVPFFVDGLICAPDTVWADEVIRECASFPRGAHDDLVDSTTQALRYLRRMGMLELIEEAVAADTQARMHRPRRFGMAPYQA